MKRAGGPAWDSRFQGPLTGQNLGQHTVNTTKLVYTSMGVSVTLRVQLPDGTPVSGARIEGTNTNAWAERNRKWPGTTHQDGTYTWSNLDKGTLGNYYIFRVTHTDSTGADWVGEISNRISKPCTLTVTLHKVESR